MEVWQYPDITGLTHDLNYFSRCQSALVFSPGKFNMRHYRNFTGTKLSYVPVKSAHVRTLRKIPQSAVFFGLSRGNKLDVSGPETKVSHSIYEKKIKVV